MKLEYNGVKMAMLDIHDYERTVINDPSNTDLLYIRHLLNVSVAVYPDGYPVGMTHTGALSERTAAELESKKPNRYMNVVGGIQGNPNFLGRPLTPQSYEGPKTDTFPHQPGVEGAPAFVTDKIVLNRLAIHRQKLKLTAYDSKTRKEYVWLESPRPGLTVDSANGPRVTALNVIEPTGEGMSMALNLQIETCLPPVCLEGERPVLSHRWTSEITHDENYYPTRTVKGLAVFDAGLMWKFRWNPDSFSKQLYHPIPAGYRRTLGPIEFDETNTTLRYEFSDTLVEGVFDPANTGATQMEIVEDMEFVSPTGKVNILGAVGALFER